MSNDPVVLFDNGDHRCLMFDTLVTGEGVQSNQFLIVDGNEEALLDPGGDMTYTPLQIELSKLMNIDRLRYVFASHQDPDIIASIDRWLMYTPCKVVTSKLWARFLPHLASSYVSNYMKVNVFERIVPVPDEGANIAFGKAYLTCMPAHFLHSVGNLHFYDPVSKILFSGDMGASLSDERGPVKDFKQHIPSMEGFHRRYMVSNKACRLWAETVRKMNVSMIVPQHGQRFEGKEMITQFLDWISELKCGVDLLTPQSYHPPKTRPIE